MIDALRELGVASRADVARHTGLSRTTISGLVAEMRDEGLVVDRPGPDGDAPASGAGRPPTPIGLSSRAGAALGIDFGKRHLAVVVADLSHTLLAEDQREMEEGYDSAAGIDAAIELVEEVLDRAGIPIRQLLGVGVGLPGPVHGPSGQVGSSRDPARVGGPGGGARDGGPPRRARPRGQRRQPGRAGRAVLGRR